jgi:hypothetical protein
VRSRVFSAMLPALLAACAPSAPPASAPAPSAPADVPPVLALLDARERLALSSDQVVQLESIARDWEAANDTLSRRIGAVKGRGPRPLHLALGKHARLTREAVVENNRRAAQAVERVLQPGQRQTLCTTHRLQREAAVAVRAAKAGPGARTRAAHAGKTAARDWPWCASHGNEARSAS